MEIVLDTNLLLLLVVGATNPKYIERHKRLRRFRISDYDLLVNQLRSIKRIVVSPHILAETSNLLRSGGLRDPARAEMLERFRAMIDVVNEQHVPAIQLKTLPYFDQLGVADTGIISLCGAETLVMTVDLDLYLSVEAVGLPAINFNHLIDLEG